MIVFRVKSKVKAMRAMGFEDAKRKVENLNY